MNKIQGIIKLNLKNTILRWIEYFIYLIFLLFLLSFLMLLLAEKPISDDFINFYKFSEWGYFKFIINHYYYWEGSYSQSIIQVPLTYFIVKFNASVYYNLAIITLFISGIYLNIKIYLKNNQKFYAIVLIVLYFLATYFTNYKLLRQVFLWNTGNMAYFLPFVFLFFGFYYIQVQNKKFKILGFISLILYAGFRISLNVELMIIASVFLFGGNSLKGALLSFKNPVFNVILIVMSCSIFYYMSPSNDVRMLSTGNGLMEGKGLKEKIFLISETDNFYSLITSLTNLWGTLHYKSGIYPYLVMIIVAFFMHIRGINIKFQFWVSLTAYLLMFIGHGLLMFLIFGGSGPPRVLIFLVLMRNYVLILSFQLLLGKMHKVFSLSTVVVLFVALFVLKAAMYTTKRAFQENVSYRAFYDNRLKEVYQQSELDTLLLTPSPDWKFFYHDDNSWSWDRSYNGKQVRYKSTF